MSYCIYLRKSRKDLEAEQTGQGETLARHERTLLPEDPEHPFAERAKPLDMEACFAEALRCMTCGSKSRITYTDDCMTCFNCELNCPSGAIFVHPFKERFARTLDQIEVAKS